MSDKTQWFEDPLSIWDHIDIAMVRGPKSYTYHNHGNYVGDRASAEAFRDRDKIEKIQLGAGFKMIEGWRNLEYPDWNADKPIPADGYSATEIGFLPGETSLIEADFRCQASDSVHEIASYHTLDHLSPKQVIQTLREVERVLVPHGTFTNIVPHADSQLAKECIHHQSRFMIDTWRNIFSERQYEHDGEWRLEVGLNFTFAIAERNTVLCTQLIKKG